MGFSNEFKDYMEQTRSTAVYPGAEEGNSNALAYVSLGLAGEAGEIANKVKKILRDSGGEVSDEVVLDLLMEAGDVLWYLARLVDELQGSLDSVAAVNLNKLNSRKERGVIGGSGDNR